MCVLMSMLVLTGTFTSFNLLNYNVLASSSIDFNIEWLDVNKAQFLIGETVNIWVEIKNTGTEKIEAYDLEASFSLISSDDETISIGKNWNGWDIPPGNLDIIDIYWTVPSTAKGGWYGCEVSIIHKPTSLSKKTTRNNLFQVITSPPDIDLVGEFYVNGIRYEDESKIYLTSISAQVKYVIRNLGSQDAGAFNVRFKEANSNWTEIKRYSGLAAGHSIEFEKIFSPLYIKQLCLPHMHIDFMGEVAEKNESNNDCAIFVYPTMDVTPDFEILPYILGISLMPGSSTSFMINVTSLHGFSSLVTLSISWKVTSPQGVTWVFSENSVVPTSTVTLTFTASSSASAGVFSFLIVGSSGSMTRYSKPVCLTIIETCTGETSLTVASACVQNLIANKWVFIDNPFEGVLYEDALQYILAIWDHDRLFSNNFGQISVGLTIQNNGAKTARNVKATVVISGSVTTLALIPTPPMYPNPLLHPSNGKWYSFTSTHSFSIGDIPPWEVVSLELSVPLGYASVVLIYAPLQLGLSPWVMCLLPGVYVQVTVSGDNTNVDQKDATPPGIPLGLYGIDAESQACQALSAALACVIQNKLNLPNAWEYLSKEFEKFVAAMAIDVAVDAIISKITEGAMQITQVFIDVGSGAVKQLSAILGWKGSSIKLTIISPSGKVYTAFSLNTTSAIKIYDIELGTWAIQLLGEEIPEEGEDYSLALVVSESNIAQPTCYLTTDKIEYSLQEPVEIILHNTGDSTVNVDPSFAIFDEISDMICNWTIAPTPITLAPGEAITTFWNQTSNNGIHCLNGNYFIRANTSIGILTKKITLAQPPRIINIEKNPDLDYYPEWSKVTISATVSDEGSGVKNVILYYRNDRDSSFGPIPMEYNFSQQVYEATLPGQPAGTTVEYFIVAYDRAGNSAVENNSGIYYNYQVIPEFPSLIILSSFMIATIFTAVILLKKKNRISKPFRSFSVSRC